MSAVQEIYQRLRSINEACVDQSMAAALPTADPGALRVIALSLLERQHHDGITGLLHNYERLAPDIQGMMVRQADRWYRPLREVTAQKAIQGPANVIRIIVAARLAKLAYLVAGQLHHRPEGLRAQAADGLLEMACWVGRATNGSQDGGGGDDGQPRCTAESAQYIQAVVEEAVEHYSTHEQPALVTALLALTPRPMPGVLGKLDHQHNPAVGVLKPLLAQAADADARRATLVMAQVASLAGAAVEGLLAASSAGTVGDVLDGSHLLLNRRVVEPMGRIAEPQRLWPSDAETEGWSAGQTRGLARWAVALPWSPRRRIEALSGLTGLHDPLSRLAALRQLIEIAQATRGNGGDRQQAQDAVGRFCVDAEMKIAWIALRYLVACDWHGLPGMLPRLINSPHADVAELARGRIALVGFERLWKGWPRMTPQKRLGVGLALIKIDPSFHVHLAAKLGGSDTAGILRALSIIHTLSQGAYQEIALVELVRHEDPKISASAVRALGTAQSPRSVKVLEKALAHPDSRVRANAVEALEQAQSHRHIRELAKMAHEDQNRPRANAIQSLMKMRAGDALAALSSMLHDPRPAQRISALWVVEVMGLVELARQVAEAAVSDTDDRVKQRADRVIHDLMRIMDPHRQPLPELPQQT